MKRPSFQFYPGDWRKNAKLRRCSDAARGVWIDVLCLLHDSEEYGVLRWPLSDIARASGAAIKLLRELSDKGVLKGSDSTSPPYIFTPRHAGQNGQPVLLVEPGTGPCWYSSRFVRDEYIRQRRGQSTQFSSENQPPKAQPKRPPMPPFGERLGDGPSASSSTTSKSNTPIPPDGGSHERASKPRKANAIALQTFLDQCREAGQKPIPADDAVFEYAASAGITQEFLRLQWFEFKDRYTAPSAKRYKSWSTVFGKSVRGNWFKLWYALSDGSYALTTVGQQAQRVHGKEAP